MDFWYFLISRRATVPGLKRCGFFSPVLVVPLLFLAAFVAKCFLGVFPTGVLRAVSFVLAIYTKLLCYLFKWAKVPFKFAILQLIGRNFYWIHCFWPE